MSFTVKLAAFLAAIWLCAVTTSAVRTFETPDAYNYVSLGTDFGRRTDVRFLVKACNDAHITLQPERPADGIDLKGFEIVIGGWNNGVSAIRQQQQGDHQLAFDNAVRLNCNEYRAFWVSWAHAEIRVGEGSVVNRQTFLHLPMIKTIGISSWYDTPGDWQIAGQTIHTTDFYTYQLLNKDFTNETSMAFRVKTCSNAHLSLQAHSQSVDDGAYEIVIGGGGDTSSRIRSGHQGNDLVQVSGSRLDCDRYRDFWVSWDDNRIRVGEGRRVHSRMFMQAPLVRNVGISTGWGATGSWIIL